MVKSHGRENISWHLDIYVCLVAEYVWSQYMSGYNVCLVTIFVWSPASSGLTEGITNLPSSSPISALCTSCNMFLVRKHIHRKSYIHSEICLPFNWVSSSVDWLYPFSFFTHPHHPHNRQHLHGHFGDDHHHPQQINILVKVTLPFLTHLTEGLGKPAAWQEISILEPSSTWSS